MIHSRLGALLLVLLLTSACLPPERYDPPRARLVDGEWVPMELYLERYVYIDGTVNALPTEMLLDSGAGITVIDRNLAREIGARDRGPVSLLGVGGVDEARLVEIDLQIGSLFLAGVVAASTDLEFISTRIGRDMPVILGRDVFESAVVDIDYPNRRIAFHDPEGYVYVGAGSTLRVRPEGDGTWLVSGRVEGLPPAAFKIDTGSGHALDIFKPFADRHGLLKHHERHSTHLTAGVGGTMRSRVATLSSFEIGGYILRDVPCYFPQEAKGVFNTRSMAGNLGAGILSRFRTIFDYSREQLHLEAGSGMRSTPFRKDRLGLITVPEGQALRVAFVAPGSPAERDGWKRGDAIVAIDGVSESPQRLKKLLERRGRGSDGTRVTLRDSRGNNRTVVLATYY